MKLRLIISLLFSALLIAGTAEYEEGHIGVLATLEKESYDWRLTRHLAHAQKNSEIVIVDIDRDTLRKIGNNDFKLRSHFADLNDSLFNHYKALAAAYTVPLPPQDNPYIEVVDEVAAQQDDPIIREQLDNFKQTKDTDPLYRDSIQKNVIVLGHRFDETHPTGKLPRHVDFYYPNNTSNIDPQIVRRLGRGWGSYPGYTGNVESFLSQNGQRAGHVNFSVDDDGTVRRMPLLLRHGGKFFISQPLALLIALRGQAPDKVTVTTQPGSNQIDGIVVGSLRIPLNKDGSTYIKFKGKGGQSADFEGNRAAVFRYLSSLDVSEQKLDRELLSGKIVIIGSSDLSRGNLHTTPVNATSPSSEIVATQLANMLENTNLHRLPNAQLVEIIATAVISVLLSFLFVYFGPAVSAIILAAFIAGHVYFVLNAWDTKNEVWTMTAPILAYTLLFIFNTIANFFFSSRDAKRMQSTFGQYIPEEVARQLAESNHAINMEGEERDVSVLFSDVREFTSISEHMTPKQLILFMNHMLTDLTEAIHENGGTVDKFIGDAVMALWNAPMNDPAHAEKAVLAAMAMQQALQQVEQQFPKLSHPLRMGIGIATGKANVGNMGSKHRVAYTAMGDTVNLSARLEGITKYYGCPIVVSKETRDQCADVFTFRTIDIIRVKGRSQPVEIYEPWEKSHLTTPEQLAQLKAFNDIRKQYANMEFAFAQKNLSTYIQKYPTDGVAHFYQTKIAQLLNHVPDDWDGVTSFTQK